MKRCIAGLAAGGSPKRMNTKLLCLTLVLPAVLLVCAVDAPLAAQGIITTLAGADWVFPGAGGPALDAPLGGVSGLALDTGGELFVADPDNLMLMRVDPDGTLEVIAGTGIRVTAGDEGPALTASLRGPAKLTRDVMGNLYFIDIDPNVGVRLRQLTADGLMAHFAGRGPFGFGGDGGPAIEALFRFPEDLTAGPGGVYVADTGNDRVRWISNDGMISTFAGSGERGFSGDGEAATSASLNRPAALALNSSNELLIADNGNWRIRKVGPKGIISTVAGTGENIFSPDGIPAQQASLGAIGSLAFDDADNLYLSETFDGVTRIRPHRRRRDHRDDSGGRGGVPGPNRILVRRRRHGGRPRPPTNALFRRCAKRQHPRSQYGDRRRHASRR